MKSLFPEFFFDLSDYRHERLFDRTKPVWEALTKISSYLAILSLGKIEVDIPANAFIINSEQISIGSGSVVEPGAYIKGPCIIGNNCVVRHGAYIRGDLICGDGCVIGHDTEIKNAILLNNAHAAHFAYVGDSILGNRVNLGAGTKCANLKLDKSLIEIVYNDKKLSSGLRKLGAIIGDDAQVGCNAVTNPGACLGKGVLCYPCLNIGGYIPAHSIIKSDVKNQIIQR